MATLHSLIFVIFLGLSSQAAHALREDESGDGGPLDGLPTDHRDNIIKAATAETLWSVGVLSNCGQPNTKLKETWTSFGETVWSPTNTNMDLLWAWIQAMANNSYSGIPLRMDPPMDNEAAERNKHPETLIGALFTGHKFKNGQDELGRPVFGMDFYVGSRLKWGTDGINCTGESVSLLKEHFAMRKQPFFAERGRKEINMDELPLQRKDSLVNHHAGIVPLEHIPNEAKNFFPIQVMHAGKNLVARIQNEYGPQKFADVGAPFIGGASGSIEFMILSMEDMCKGPDESLASCPRGLVPCGNPTTKFVGGKATTTVEPPHLREALLGIMTAALVAGGQHSITECLVVAQARGYFEGVPNVLENYAAALEAFEARLEKLGVVAEGAPLAGLLK